MPHHMLIALFFGIASGIMSGSFAVPIKRIKKWNFEHIWLNYAIWAFLILPLGTAFILYPQVWQIYKTLSLQAAMIIFVGGFCFGAGQVCFALSLKSLGMGIAFIINIGLGTALGFLLPLLTLHPDKIWTQSGIMSLLGICCIILSLCISYYAGSQRDKQKKETQETYQHQTLKKNTYILGVVLAILAGVFSGGQNYTFALTSDMQQLALSAGANSWVAAIIMWPPFLVCAFIPYLSYMLYLHVKKASFSFYRKSSFLRNYSLVVATSIIWFCGLFLYSKSSMLIGDLGPVLTWPLSMSLIILTSNFWSWRNREWAGCRLAVKRNAILSIVVLVVAVAILAYSADLSS